MEEQHFEEDAKGALAAYAAKEAEHRDDHTFELVLIGSDSIETVRLKHANYFDGTASVSKYLAGI